MRAASALAVILTALALVPGAAHVAELPAKLNLDRAQYVAVQQIYRGWALFGVIIVAALLANLAVAILFWRRRQPFALPVIACLAVAASLGIFFAWVFPTNLATNNWTQMPANWEELRTHWEFGHTAAATLMFIALCSIALAGSASAPGQSDRR